MYKVILFDLDGTLTESGEGITKSVQYALERIGKPEPDLEKLKVFIGPPLMEMFMQYAQIDEATAKQAVEIYRERYSVTGIFENAVYPGIENMLAQLEKKGYIFCGWKMTKPVNGIGILYGKENINTLCAGDDMEFQAVYEQEEVL